MVSRVAKAAAGVIPAAALTRLGMPALGSLVLLAVLVLAVACWVIGSQDRTNRVSQILLARRGAPAVQPTPAAPPAETGLMRRALRRATGHKKQEA
jgi:hypothetical protein